MSPLERLHAALRAPAPAPALRAAVTSLGAEGHSKAAIYQLLEQLLLDLRADGATAEQDEELVLDVLDAVSGWCHPTARLLADDEPV
jgi:hypothetical protein